MSEQNGRRVQRDPSRRVRPRLVWGGTAAALIGCSIATVGGVVTSWTWTGSGAAVLVVGAAVAFRGGIMRDTSSGGVRSELAHLIHGEDRQGVAPGDISNAPPPRRHFASRFVPSAAP